MSVCHDYLLRSFPDIVPLTRVVRNENAIMVLHRGHEEADMSLLISVRNSGNITILDVRGSITIGAGSDSFKAKLRTLAETMPCNILINLAEVTQVDSTGINALVQSYVTLKRNGGNLKILHPTGHVREVLEVTHLTTCLPVYTDEAEALASFRASTAHA